MKVIGGFVMSTKYSNIQDLIKKEGLEDFFVSDLNLEESEIIFVLESPHKDEVKKKYPVAGSSGVKMSKTLFNKSTPLGKLINDELRKKENGEQYDKQVLAIGVLNVANIPLQNIYKISNETTKVIEQLSGIRKSHAVSYFIDRQNTEKDNFTTIVLTDFEKRLKKCLNKKVILCGKFSEGAFDKLNLEYEVVRIVHPSMGWSLTNDIKDIKTIISRGVW